MGMMYELATCLICKREKLKFPEGCFCPCCQSDVIAKLAKKYADMQMKLRVGVDDEP